MIDPIDKRIERIRKFLQPIPLHGEFNLKHLMEALNEGTDYLKVPIRVLIGTGEVVLVRKWQPGRGRPTVYAKGQGTENEV